MLGYDGPLQYTMVRGDPDLSTDVIHLTRSFLQDSDGMRNNLPGYYLSMTNMYYYTFFGIR